LESPRVEAEADLVVPGPAGIVALLAALAGELEASAAQAVRPGG
jgi:hypothetical protein